MKVTFLAFALIQLFSLPTFAADLPIVQLTVKDGTFIPDKIEIPPGQKVQLLLKNEGVSAEEFESTDLNREKVVAPGKTIVIYLGPLDEGTYRFFGDFHADTAKGKLVVKK